MTSQPECPAPIAPSTVQLAHGGGGRLMRRLIESVFFEHFGAPERNDRQDSFVAGELSGRVAVTTDSYVVTPLFFPGGDIGSLAVNGTVNDLAMVGAEPRLLTAGFILEEGLPIDDLRRIAASMSTAARAAGARIVSGDTKVVDRGHGHGVFINTTGVGVVHERARVAPSRIAEGDAIVLSGDLGRHGVAVLSVREGLQFEGALGSDCAPLWEPVKALFDARIGVRCLRDLTRGGLAAALCEIALDAPVDLAIDEAACPVEDAVAGACELLGLDPLYVANEGRFVAFVAANDTERALEVLRRFEAGQAATAIGRVTRAGPEALGRVIAKTTLGSERVVDLLSGEQLPRIC